MGLRIDMQSVMNSDIYKNMISEFESNSFSKLCENRTFIFVNPQKTNETQAVT